MITSHLGRPMVLTIFGGILLSLGIISIFTLPYLLLKIVDNELVLSPKSQGYDFWRQIPIPIYQRFYFFNVSNAEDVERSSAKPILAEVGPFTYRSYWKKQGVRFNSNSTVSYREYKTWKFVRSLSVASEDFEIVTLNTPLASTLTLIQTAPAAVRMAVTLALDGLSEGFFIRRSPRQLLFAVYPDVLTQLGPILNREIPASPGGRFGFLYPRNGSDDGLLNVNTGADDIEELNVVQSWNGQNEMPWWSGPECNSLEGSTNAQIFPPLRDAKHGSSVKMFYPDFCRVWKFNYNSTTDLGDGLTTHRFLPDENLFTNPREYPPNRCYKRRFPVGQNPLLATRPPNPAAAIISSPLNPINLITNLFGNRNTRTQQLFRNAASPVAASQTASTDPNSPPTNIRTDFPSGVFDLSGCKYGAPIILSFPHFLDADPVYLQAVNGLRPNRSAHEFFMDVEPTTGTVIGLAARAQLNVAINKPPAMFRYRNIPDIVFPCYGRSFPSFPLKISRACFDGPTTHLPRHLDSLIHPHGSRISHAWHRSRHPSSQDYGEESAETRRHTALGSTSSTMSLVSQAGRSESTRNGAHDILAVDGNRDL